MQKFKSVDQLVNQLKPVEPTYCIRKNSIQLASKFFQKKFPGKILYAVKTNPHPIVLKTLIESGIESFDVASIKEIKTIKKIKPNANCYFMHTVKRVFICIHVSLVMRKYFLVVLCVIFVFVIRVLRQMLI